MNEKKNEKMDYKTLNELIKTGNTLLKFALAILVLSICVLIIYLLDKTSVLVTIKHILGIISPLFIGLFIAWALEPAVNYFVKNKVNRKLAVVAVYLIFIFLIILILALMLPEFIAQLNELIKKVPDFLGSINNFINDIFANISNSDLDLSKFKDNLLTTINDSVNNLTANNLTGIINGVGNSLKVVINAFITLLIAFYLSLDFKKVGNWFRGLVPKKYQDEFSKIKTSLDEMLRSYVNGTLLSSLFVMILSLIGFLISGVSSPLLFAIFCAITNIIPYFGPYIGGIPVVVVGYATSPVVGTICLVTVVLVQTLEGNILHPLIVGKAVSLHPITIMLGLLVFEYLFGIVGMILAAPVIATLKILYFYLEEKYHFLSNMKNKIFN